MPLEEALAFLPERPLDPAEQAAVRHGRRLPAGPAAEPAVRLTHAGELVAVAEPRDGELQPVVVFAPA